MRTIITAVIAAVVIAAGAFAATAVVAGQATAQESDEPAIDQQHVKRHRGAILEETLSELVAAGTITQAQADAITEALAAKAEEYQEERQQRREDRQQRREDRQERRAQFRSYLEDGVVDSDELAEFLSGLPDDHWLKDPNGPAAPYLEDGQLTTDELRRLREGFRRHHGGAEGDALAPAAEPTGAQI